MVREYKRKRTKTYTPEDLNDAVKKIKEGSMTLRKAHNKYKIPLGTLSNHVHSKGKGYSKAGRPSVFDEETELAMANHLVCLGEWGFPFDTLDIRMFAKQVLCEEGRNVPQFDQNLPSKESAILFLKRQRETIGLRRCQNLAPSKAAVSAEDVNAFLNNLQQSMREADGSTLPPNNVFNYDETNLSDNPGTKMCIFKRKTKYPERIRSSSKTAVSLMFCGSASGQMLPPYVVYKSENLWTTWTEGGPENCRYNRSRSEWFDATTFADWFEFTFIPHCRLIEGRKVIIGDSLSSHFSKRVLNLSEQSNITFICLPPNSTHLLQPLDVAFFCTNEAKMEKNFGRMEIQSTKTNAVAFQRCIPKTLEKVVR